MKQPTGEQIGTITIKVFKGGATYAEIKGNVPHNAIMHSRLALQQAFARDMNSKGAQNKRKVQEEARIALQKEQEEQRKVDEVKVERMRLRQEILDKAVANKQELDATKGIDPKGLEEDDRKNRAKLLMELQQKHEEFAKQLEEFDKETAELKESEGTDSTEDDKDTEGGDDNG